jgi:tight adherence protein B
MGSLNIVPDLGYSLGLAATFAGVCLFFSGFYLLVVKPLRSRHQVTKRLSGSAKDKLARVQILKAAQDTQKSLLLSLVERLAGWGKIEYLQHKLLQADIYWHPSTFLSVVGILACLGLLIGMMRESQILGIGLAVGLGYLPFFFLRLKKQRKSKLFEKQMPEAMELLARSLRAGHTLPSAIDLLSQEIGYPLGTEMKIVYEEQRLGLGLSTALRRMGERVASPDLRYFVTAVLIQTETGGNLAEIMENIGYIIRERLKLAGKIKGLTAEGRFSALILGLLPVVIFIIMSFVNHDYIMTLWKEPTGYKLLTAGSISVVMGWLWMKKMVQIQV